MKISFPLPGDTFRDIILQKGGVAMETMQSIASLKRQEQRESEEMQAFKRQILAFLDSTEASPDIRYHIIKDLAKMTNMPFYKDSHYGRRNRMAPDQAAKNYCALFSRYYADTQDVAFIEKMFSWLTRQQQQQFRKLSRLPATQKAKRADAIKRGATGVYEHPIPVNYTKKLLISYIVADEQPLIHGYIDFVYGNTYQVFLESYLNAKVNRLFHDTMPPDWDWTDPQRNHVFARYVAAEIPCESYR